MPLAWLLGYFTGNRSAPGTWPLAPHVGSLGTSPNTLPLRLSAAVRRDGQKKFFTPDSRAVVFCW